MAKARRGVDRDAPRRAMLGLVDQVLKPAGRPAELDPRSSLLDFVEHHGLTIDNHPYDMRGRFRHLRALYEDNRRDLTVMAGAQSGKTAWELALMLRIGCIEWGHNVGAYYPDQHLPRNFSRARFAPMLRNHPLFRRYLGKTGRVDPATGKPEKGADMVFTRSFGLTDFYFLSVAGVSSTEGLPMKAVVFDEVRRMAEGDVQRAEERTSGQDEPWIIRVSTAQFHESDIHKAFLRGDQQFFHTDCRCPDGVVLSQTFPDCILDLSKATEVELASVREAFTRARLPYLGCSPEDLARYKPAVYRCPGCGQVLADPRDGWWQAHNPDALPGSYQLPQLLHPAWPAARVWAYYQRPGLDTQEFHNSKLGLPFISKESTGVTIDDLWRAVNPELVWPGMQSRAWRRKELGQVGIGVDVQKGYLVCVVKERAPSGRYRTIHLAVLHGNSIWRDLGALVLEFGARHVVVDSMPEWDSARAFALSMRGKVFLAQYIDGQNTDMITWADRKKRGAKGEAAFPFMVNIARTRGMQWSLGLWRDGGCEIPDPRTLVVPLPMQGGRPVFAAELQGGQWEPTRIAETAYFLHLTRVVFVKEVPKDDPDGLTGRFRLVAQHVGLDPHFAHADLYADVALSRTHGARFAESGEDGVE